MIKEKYTIKDFAPLIVIFSVIVLISLCFVLLGGNTWMFGMQIFMGLFFVIFGGLKMMKLKAFAEAYSMYDVIAMKSKIYGFIYPFIEIFLGLAYLASWQLNYINYITLVVMLVSAWGVYIKLRKKEKIMCACLGTVFKVPMTWVTLIEDLLMAIMALAMIILGGNSILVSEYSNTISESQIIELKNGDTYEMVASIVNQEVGNRIIKRLAYNGQIPGPVLKVEKDAEITLKLTNNLDVETTLHSHGLRLDNAFDGVPDVTQKPIKIGDSFTYKLKFPDEGIYWYHPHIREDYTQELGLYGNFLVTPADEEYWNEVSREEFLILDDFLEDGKFNKEVVTNTLMGRFGDKLLINDKENYNLNVNQGETARLYITNVANTRTFDFEIEGLKMKLVGGDVGRIENEVFINSQIIAPAERYIVEVLFEEVGTYEIKHRGNVIGNIVVKSGNTPNTQAISKFKGLRNNASDYEDIRNDISNLVAQKPDKKLRLDINMMGQMGEMMMGDSDSMMGMNMSNNSDDEMMKEHCKMMPGMAGCEEYLEEEMPNEGMGMNNMMMNDHSDGDSENEEGIEWEDHMPMMNNMSSDENVTWQLIDEETGEINGDIKWDFELGDLVKVSIYNDPNTMHPMQHPIHFHGQRFVILSEDGLVNDNLQWKDTVLIPKGKTIEVLVEMSNSGTWMAHCHIAEHLHAGMMMSFDVK